MVLNLAELSPNSQFAAINYTSMSVPSHDETVRRVESDYVNKYFFLNTRESDSKTFEIITAIRYEPHLNDGIKDTSPFFLFEEHLHRLKLELEFFQWGFSISKQSLLSKLQEVISNVKNTDIEYTDSTPYKLRLRIDKEGVVNIEATKVPERSNLLDGLYYAKTEHEKTPSLCYAIYIDSEEIPISVFTSFKTTYRDHYNRAREKLLSGKSQPADVLLHNSAGQVTETSICNVAFYRQLVENDQIVYKWITPAISLGCLCGVVRQMLITKGLVVEGNVSIADVEIGEEILVFNGIIGVARGKIVG